MGNSAKIRHCRHRRQLSHCAIEAVIESVDEEVVTLRTPTLEELVSSQLVPDRVTGAERKRRMREARRFRRRDTGQGDEQID